MDFLVLENFLIDKTKQPDWQEAADWKQEFELD
jgi:carbamoyltransferase